GFDEQRAIGANAESVVLYEFHDIRWFGCRLEEFDCRTISVANDYARSGEEVEENIRTENDFPHRCGARAELCSFAGPQSAACINPPFHVDSRLESHVAVGFQCAQPQVFSDVSGSAADHSLRNSA